jgi:hypothetical protein
MKTIALVVIYSKRWPIKIGTNSSDSLLFQVMTEKSENNIIPSDDRKKWNQ